MNSRQPVAFTASQALQTKFQERQIRSQTQHMRVEPVEGEPTVLRVLRREDKRGICVQHVLVGLHRGMTFFDDDHERTSVYTPPTRPDLKFRLGWGTAIFDKMPGLIPVACTCPDWLTRGTSSKNGSSGTKSVNDSKLKGNARLMGAVMGCKHMDAAEEYLMRGDGVCEYFDMHIV